MSNLPTPLLFDATGVTDGVALANGSPVLRINGADKRLVVHDGTTVGGIPHVPRFPANPASVLQSNYDSLNAAFAVRFYDSANSRLFPTRGLGNNNAGCPDTTLPDGSGNKLSPWQWAQGVRALADRYYNAVTASTSTTDAKARVAGAWAYFQTQFSNAQMLSKVYGTNQTTGLMDDSAWFASALADIITITGDANAKVVLAEYAAVTYIIYQDTRSSNPIVSYGVSTPAGTAIQRNTLGLRYDQSGGNGDINTCHEVWLGKVDLFLSQQPTTTALTDAMKAAYLQRAKDTWQWAYSRLRYAGSAVAVAGIYVSSLNLAPGSNPGSQRYLDVGPTTKRGLTAFADHGTLAMGSFSDALYTLTADPKYLAEFDSIAEAYPTQTTGFGRLWNGRACLVNAQDPWTGGFEHGEFTRRLVARYPIVPGQPIVHTAYRFAVLGAAHFIAFQSASGLISPNWGPPEVGSNAGADTWERDSMAGYSGVGGGGQASGRQIMAAASGLIISGAGAQLAGTEAALGSGMSPGGIEIAVGQLSAAVAAIQAALLNPIETRGPYSRRIITADGTVREFLNEIEIRRFDSGGQTIFGASTLHGTVSADGTITTNGGFVALNGTTSGQFYVGLPGGYPGLNFQSGCYVGSQTGLSQISTVINNSELFRVSSSGIFNYGVSYHNNDILPINDNVISVGGTGLRFKNIYATNSTINTSDQRDKNWIASGLSDKEYRAALRILKEVGSFTWKANADRVHYGVRAQVVWQICIDEGLIPSGSLTSSPLSFLVYDKWDAQPEVPAVQAVEEVSHLETRTETDGTSRQVRVVDVEGVMGVAGRAAMPAGDRYGVRDEIDKFMLAALARLNATQIEAALNAQ